MITTQFDRKQKADKVQVTQSHIDDFNNNVIHVSAEACEECAHYSDAQTA